MPQLKPSFIAELKSSFEGSTFTGADFEFDFPDRGNPLVKVKFLHKPEYLLLCSEIEKQERVTVSRKFTLETLDETRRYSIIQVTITPGEYKARDEIEISKLGELTEIVPKWCDYIRADLYALAPKIDPLKELREKFNTDIESGIDDPEAFFSESEVNAIGKKFDEMLSQLNQLKDEFSLTKQQLDEVRKEVEHFKSSAKKLPKGIWAKVTSNKLVQTFGKFINTPEGRKFLFDQAKRLLGGEST